MKAALSCLVALALVAAAITQTRVEGVGSSSPAGGGNGVWGQITGTLSDQTDLNTALGGKAASNASTTVNGQACALGSTCTVTDSTAEKTANKGQASGYASLDGSTKVPIAQIPTGTTSSTVALGNDSRFTRLPVFRAGSDGGPALQNWQLRSQYAMAYIPTALTVDAIFWACDAGATTFKLFKRNAGSSTALTGTLTPASSGTVRGVIACASNGGGNRTFEGNSVPCGSLSATAVSAGDTLETDNTPTADGTSARCSAVIVGQ